ncbi:sensor histidine kinase [Bradyrhizobium sp. 2TAF24]|uniref:sensor histidine kinase n=1 Tax=Bradyrhizobium sp. 2TAF24 TaxID=3233011 RepID=UPI003F904CA5
MRVPAALVAVLLTVVATVGLLLLDAALSLELSPIVYMIPVLIAATRWGFWPAMAAAITGTLAADFFFLTPYYSLRVDDPQEAINLALFLLVAMVCSNLAARLRQEAEALRQSEQSLQGLYEFSRQLALCFTVRDLVLAIQAYVSATLGRRAAFVASSDDDDIAAPDGSAVPADIRREALAMIVRGDVVPRTAFDGVSQTFWILKAVSSEAAHHGVIVVDIGGRSEAVIDRDLRRLEAVIDEAAVTLARIDVGTAMGEARLRLRDELLKDALHGVISHELRTPLTSILGAASVLEATPAIRTDATVRGLVDGIHDEAVQLDGFLRNLVDASRVTSRGVRPRVEWADPCDIMNAAIERKTRRLARHRVRVEFDEQLPLVKVDAVLIAEACGQLLDNAAKYSPAGSLVVIRVRADAGHIAFMVLDEGVGLTSDEQRQLGRKTFRGARHLAAVPGFGLGLWIASAFVKANGGVLALASRGASGGTVATITLPVACDAAPELTVAAP